MKKKKILTISTSGFSKKEGISTVILDYYKYLDKEKFELVLIVAGEYNKDLVKEFQKIGVSIYYLPCRKKFFIKYIRAIFKILKTGNYDAIYTHGSSAIMTIELFIAKICGCKKRIVHSHNTVCQHKIADRILRPIFYASYTKALACGKDAGEWLYGHRKFEIIQNGRDIKVYQFNPEIRSVMRKKLGIDDGTLLVGHVGNFNEQKNQKFLVEIIKKLKSENVKLYLMGDGKTRYQIEEFVKIEELKNKIVFTGSISNVPDMLQAMDVMVLPSLYEGLPLVAIEWQISALPCILSDTITRECAYTNLVNFLSLNESPELWSKEILKYVGYDREKISDFVIEQTKEHGFSLEDNIERLQTILENS